MPSSLPNTPSKRLGGHKGPIHALTYSSGAGQYILSGSSDRTINLYNPTKASPLVQSFTGAHGYEVLSISVADDNARFVSGGGDKTVFLWDVATARTLRRYTGHAGRVECVAFGGDGDAVVVSGSFDGTVRLWDTKGSSGKPLMVLGEARDGVQCVAVTGGEIVAGSVDGRLRTYDLRMGMVHVDVIGQPITSVTPSAQADTLLVSSLDSTLRLMDTANGKMLQSYTGEGYTNTTYRVRSTLGARDAYVLSGSEDGGIFAWDALSGEIVQRLQHEEEGTGTGMGKGRRIVSAVACRRRGDQWASAGGDGTIVIWGHDG